MIAADIIFENAILIDGNVSFDSKELDKDGVDVADNYIQLLIASDSIKLLCSFTQLDLVVYFKNGHFNRPLNNGFKNNFNVVTAFAKYFLELGVRTTALVSFEGDGTLCFVIPVILNNELIGCEFLGSFEISDSMSLSLTKTSTFDAETLKSALKWACAVGSQHLRRACASAEAPQRKLNQTPYYVAHVVHNEQYHEFLENLYSPCYEYDFVTGLWECSRKVKSLLGIDDGYRNDFKGLFGLFARESKIEAYKYFTDILRGRFDELHIDLKIIRPIDGETRWIQINGSFLTGTDGEVMKVFGSVSDITLYKETLSRLRAEIDQRSKLMSIIGHDLRNPFNAILGFADMLDNVLRQKRYNDALEYARIMRDSASQGYELLVNILEYSKCVTGRLKMNVTDFDLNDVVESAVSLVRLMTDHKNITVVNNVESGTVVSGDSTMISTVMRNLISNAVKFCYEGGQIGIDVEDIEDKGKRISVWDTGVVIPPKTILHIVNEREIASTVGTSGEVGTGIGLQLCSNFLALHNTRLHVSSNEARTVFSFVL
ncbi:MAG: hypothetical protein IKS00_07365 [Bacteroidales bacterium]|nr:hypothetical protein [Bacteroidales bacterium]